MSFERVKKRVEHKKNRIKIIKKETVKIEKDREKNDIEGCG